MAREGRCWAQFLQILRPLNLASLIGLGAGTLAVYGMNGDLFRYFEINPIVTEFAWNYFTYLSDSEADIEVILGDGRLGLESAAEPFDIIVVDAFSGDSVPVHLITVEAAELYLARLRPGGTIAFHISNRYVDLKPVVARLANELDLRCLIAHNAGDDKFVAASVWVLMGRRDEPWNGDDIEVVDAATYLDPNVKLWTDDYSNVFQVLQ